MRPVLILAFALLSGSVFADSEANREPASFVPLRNRTSVEVVGTMNGNVGANTRESANGDLMYVSDSNLGVAAHRFVNENFAVGMSFDFGSSIADEGRGVKGARVSDNAQEIFLRPLLVGARYQLDSIGGSPYLRPFVEIGVGPTFATVYSGPTSKSTSAYLSGQIGFGLDAFFDRAMKFYVGARGSYLAVNRDYYSYVQSSILLGYLF